MGSRVTIEVDDALTARLQRLAQRSGKNEPEIAVEALRRFVELEEWQIEQIEAAVRKADAGEFATAERVEQTLARWGVDAGPLAR